MKAITIMVVAAAVVLLLITVAVAITGCAWDTPSSIIPEPDNACGMDWHSCHDGKCCMDPDRCLPAGGCEFGGTPSSTWGVLLGDAGRAAYPEQTPEQVRRRREQP